MTLPQLEALALLKYPSSPKDCRLEKLRKQEQRRLYIERLKKEYDTKTTISL
jgi:hypothetical protein